MKFHVRVFKPNPGGAYDPAPLHDFDLIDSTFIPMVGDLLQASESEPIYEVKSRHFDYANRLCALSVKEKKAKKAQSRTFAVKGMY
ncbi:hypothetical protein [Ahrensia marina]|uniref:Uncharacterized protein n=1 Tax=Ahrensia marina TaxID=1514904 RepID=A0A0N1J6A7_9HYPH|nr:hypothetical protein [Ahrensia marina]KPA99977.1 hypothetical protein SU32_16380 [Ahrensia marina]